MDKDGHILTGAQMEIQDKAKQVDSTWESGAEQHAVHHNSHTEAESETLVSIPQAVYKPYLNGCVLSQTSFYRMDGSLVSDSLTPRLQYDTEYSVALRYVPKTLPVDLTVPANQVYLNVDSAWSAKTMTSTLSLANTDLSWTLQNLAGTQTAYAAPTGNYATHVDIQKSDGTSASDGTTVTVCETPKRFQENLSAA